MFWETMDSDMKLKSIYGNKNVTRQRKRNRQTTTEKKKTPCHKGYMFFQQIFSSVWDVPSVLIFANHEVFNDAMEWWQTFHVIPAEILPGNRWIHTIDLAVFRIWLKLSWSFSHTLNMRSGNNVIQRGRLEIILNRNAGNLFIHLKHIFTRPRHEYEIHNCWLRQRMDKRSTTKVLTRARVQLLIVW